MNNTVIFLLSLLDTFAELIQLTYELGAFTRKYILPAVLFITYGVYYYANKLWDYLTSVEYTVKVYNTPLTTGLA